MENIFRGRSIAVIDDLDIAERRYLFEQTRVLKEAMEHLDAVTMERFRINDPDFGIYEVFLEDSTRTRESFKNAAKFHRAKVNSLGVDSSSFNKGESYADTFNTLIGYRNSIFIVRSRLEGVCRWLDEECSSYAKRNKLPYKPSFINAGDGKHEHPTQELLDEFTFLEDNGWDTSQIHIALVGDLYHGRTVHSKANGLRTFDSVKVDLIAPPELALPESYRLQMEANDFIVRSFDSIDEYLEQKEIAKKWYFTRPQLERMGEQILKKQDELRRCITFREECMRCLPNHTVFYHPLPRHHVHPTIPTFLDDTPLNGWERQSINGMYVRIVLLALIAGRIGDDFITTKAATRSDDEEYIVQVDVAPDRPPKQEGYSEGVHPIRDGIVIDHICRGEDPATIRRHMAKIISVLDLADGRGGEWVSTSKHDGAYKGIIFRPDAHTFERKDLKRLAAVAAGCTLNIIAGQKVVEKYRTHLPPRIYNFNDIACINEDCISHPKNNEGVPARFERTADNRYACAYCGTLHTFKEIWR